MWGGMRVAIISVEHLTKKYKRYKKEEGMKGSIKSLFKREYIYKTAVSDLSLEIEQGEMVGLIGPNGAGKTTFIKMLTGIIPPSSGEIQVLGYYPNKLENALKYQYAVVMGQKSQLFFELTPADTFYLFKELYDLPENLYRENVDYFIELFQVQDLMNVQVRTLSLGERMKMELIVSLLHNPKILFLDEPTIGLDAATQQQIRGFLKKVNEEKGTTVLLTSHYMEDIKKLCDRCIVINHGKKLYDGSTHELFDKYQKFKKVTLQFEGERPSLLPEIKVIEEKGNELTLIMPNERTGELLGNLLRENIILDFSIEEEDIGEVARRIYEEEGGQDEEELSSC